MLGTAGRVGLVPAAYAFHVLEVALPLVQNSKY